jgi:hypothetical protein
MQLHIVQGVDGFQTGAERFSESSNFDHDEVLLVCPYCERRQGTTGK